MKSPLLLALPFLAAALPASAITRTWGDGGADDNFNNPANWNPTGAPADGDDLVFPASTAASTVNNNLTGRTFGSLTIQKAITIAGNAFTLTGGLTASGSGVVRSEVNIDANITLGADQTFTCTTGSLVFGGNVAFGARTLTVSSGRTVTFQGLTGSSTAGSRLIKTGTGVLRLDTSAIFVTNQPFTLSTGTLDVDGFLQTPLTMTGGTLTGQGNLGFSLDASGGDIIPDSGDLDVAGATTLRGDVNLRVALLGASAETQLSCGGAVAIQDQATLEVLTSAYTPVRGDSFQLLGKSPSGAITGTFSNAAANSEIPAGTSVLRLTYTGGNGNDLTLSTISTTRTWDGGATLNDNWDEADNWTGNLAPLAGDVLVFPAGIQSTDRGLDNNFPDDTTFRQIIFNGDDFTVRGNRFRLSHGINVAASVTANLDTDVILAQDQTFELNGTLHLDLLDTIDTAGRRLTLSGGNALEEINRGEIDGTISGTGGLVVDQSSHISMRARSSYSGTTVIEAGSKLRLFKESITGGESTLGGPESPTLVSGMLRVANVNLSGFKLEENLNLLPGGQIECVSSGGRIELAGDFTLEDASVAGLHVASGSTEISGRIRGSGNMSIAGAEANTPSLGSVEISGTQPNTFTGSLTASVDLTLDKSASGMLAVSCNDLRIEDGAIVETRQDEQIADDCHVQISDSSSLVIGNVSARTETIGSLSLSGSEPTVKGAGNASLLAVTGNITQTGTGLATILLDTRVEAPLTLVHCDNLIFLNANAKLMRSGNAIIRKTGRGRLELGFNQTSVPIQIADGVVALRGDTSQPVFLDGGGLTGDGTAGGGVTSQAGGGSMAPFGNASATGILSTGALNLNAATSLEMQVLNAAAGTGFDQIAVSGSLGLNGAALSLEHRAGFNVALGQSIVLLANDGTDAIIGTFAGLPQGAFIPIPAEHGGGGWIISYTGGTGNDIALTRVANPPTAEVIPTVTSFTFGNPDQNGNRPVTIAGKGTPGASYQLETSVALFPLPTWTNEGSAQTANVTTGALSFSATASPPVRQRQFWRFRKL